MNYLRRLLLRLLTPVSKVFGAIYMAPRYRSIAYFDVYELMKSAKPGDVLLAYSKGEFTNYFIPGKYKHAALYVEENCVIEAVGNGVREVYFDDFCASKDAICLLRPLIQSPEMAVIRARNQIGKPYDYKFEPNEAAFYCAELITFCYATSEFKNRLVMGVETTLPDDFRQAKNKFTIAMERGHVD